MNLSNTYFKKRKDFGKQPMFCEVPVHLLDSIVPDSTLYKYFILRNPVNRDIQASTTQSEHYINTRRVVLQEKGMNHTEGGWPKDVNCMDEEAVLRYKRRYERDEDYIDSILTAYPKFEKYLKQNNAIEMYQMYFKGMQTVNPAEKSTVVVKNKFRERAIHPVSCISWTQEDDAKLVVAYCDKTYPIPNSDRAQNVWACYVWNVENPEKPYVKLAPPSTCWQLTCSPVSPPTILGGTEDGRVCIFDIRTQTTPTAVSPMHHAHYSPVTAVMFIQSRLNTEFFSASSDGRCIWWDIRDLSNPTEIMVMSVRVPPGETRNLGNAEAVSALQYDRAFPTKFLCGTDTGLVINVNRKGKSQQEIMSGVFYAHNGPIKALHRSPLTSKMFITCGDWKVNIWSDDVLTSPIICGTAHRYRINDVTWAPQRISSYMSIGADGMFRYWDLLRKHHEPTLTYPVAGHSLLKIKPHEDGRLVAIGDSKGCTHLISLSNSLVNSDSGDKQIMLQNYERESRREHILETRIKEIRLKLKTEDEPVAPVDLVDEDALDRSAEEEYRKVVSDEMRRKQAMTFEEKPNAERKR